LRANKSIAALAASAVGGLLNRAAGNTESVQECPRDAGCQADGQHDQKRARQVEEDFTRAEHRSDPGKRHIQGAGHAGDYAQSGRAIL